MLGHGLSDKPRCEYSIDLLARHVLAFVGAIGAAKAHVIGQSLGGWVTGGALWAVGTRGDRSARITVAPSPVGGGIPEAAVVLLRDVGGERAVAAFDERHHDRVGGREPLP